MHFLKYSSPWAARAHLRWSVTDLQGVREVDKGTLKSAETHIQAECGSEPVCVCGLSNRLDFGLDMNYGELFCPLQRPVLQFRPRFHNRSAN